MTRPRFRTLAAAELAAMRGRRLGWAVVLAAAGSCVGGLAMAALVLPFDAAAAIEASTVVVSRGSAAAVAVAVLAALAVAGPYRDGSWMHAALAVPHVGRRLAAGAVPAVGLGVGLGAVAIASAAVGAALVDASALRALPAAAAAHLGAIAVWSVWLVCLAHATRSPLATLGIGAGLPLVAEPALAGLLAMTPMADARWWLLPGIALRSLAEVPVGEGVVLDGPSPAQLPLLLASVLGWTAAAALAAWLRARGAQPR
ncbi:hypothetical protein ACVWW9_001474 [Agrococcus sp. UYP33]